MLDDVNLVDSFLARHALQVIQLLFQINAFLYLSFQAILFLVNPSFRLVLYLSFPFLFLFLFSYIIQAVHLYLRLYF
jgi:hypothetical protein